MQLFFEDAIYQQLYAVRHFLTKTSNNFLGFPFFLCHLPPIFAGTRRMCAGRVFVCIPRPFRTRARVLILLIVGCFRGRPHQTSYIAEAAMYLSVSVYEMPLSPFEPRDTSSILDALFLFSYILRLFLSRFDHAIVGIRSF